MFYRSRLVIILFLTAISLSSLSIAGTLLVARWQGWLQTSSPHPTLDRVRARGYLRCGVDGKLPSFSVQQPNGASNNLSSADRTAGFYPNASGFDADFCRVVAVAIFGSYEGRIAFFNVDINQRFASLRDGAIDLLVRDTTWTANGDLREGVDFGPVIFHDGQKFIIHDNPLVSEESMTIDELVAHLTNKRICVAEKTTAQLNLQRVFKEHNINYREVAEKDNYDTAAAYSLGECEAMTADESQLLGRLATLPNSEQHKITPAQAISYAPLAPVVAEGDPHWRDLVSYAVWATIRAEELGLSQANLGKFSKQDTPLELQRFLGMTREASIPTIGESLGIAPDFTRNIIEQLGNYLEIWVRNLGGVIKERGPNQPWLRDPQGRLFAPPFDP